MEVGTALVQIRVIERVAVDNLGPGAHHVAGFFAGAGLFFGAVFGPARYRLVMEQFGIGGNNNAVAFALRTQAKVNIVKSHGQVGRVEAA